MKFIRDFKKINIEDIKTAGGKGASLGEMVQAKIPVPPGFVILVSAFDRFLEKTGLLIQLATKIKEIDYKNIKKLEKTSKIIRNLIEKTRIPKEMEKEFLSGFKKLKAKYVAVRSSATTEDSRVASWAGELESYLNITKEKLMKYIKKCWSSLFTPRALFYAFEKKLMTIDFQKMINIKTIQHFSDCYPIGIAIVVQKMIDSEVSGVCFTIHPVTKNKNQILIEAGWGLGESIVGGKITPDNYTVSKKNWTILNIRVASQEKMIVRDKKGTREVEVPRSKVSMQKLSRRQIIYLAKLCQKIENHYKIPQDIEWALTKKEFYILQSRPITNL
jgi:pyruvate,water dikinase